jgi:hypothetical protein
MRLSPGMREQWIASCREVFAEDPSFPLRLKSYLPLYGLRWCLILLNEFLFRGAENRVHADPQKAMDLTEIRRSQLGRSREMLQEIKETTHYGSAVQVS